MFFFSEIFRILIEIFSDFWPKNFKNLWKLLSACPQEQLETLNFFKWIWTVLDFLQKHLSWFSKFYIRVQSKKCGKNSLFLFSFQNFFRILTENFSDFWPKNCKKFSKLPSTCPVEQSVAWSFFLKFWIVLYFVQKPSAWFPKLYLRVQSKNCGRNSFLIFLFRIFSDSERNSSDFRPKNVKNLSKLPYACPEEQFVAWNFFLKFWIVSDFLQKPLAWFSKVYLRVQSKNCGKNILFLFSFQNFSRILTENFSDFWPKNFKKFSKLPSACPEEQFVAWIFFLKFWIVLDFLQKPLAWFSKFYLRVRTKICGRNSFFLLFFSEFFLILSEIFSDFWPKNFKMFSKLPSTCPEEQFAAFFSKSFEPFWIFYRNLYDGSQNSIYVSRVKIAEEIVFFCFLFRIFFEFWPKIFQTFGQKTSRSCQIYFLRVACPEEQFVAWIFFSKVLNRFVFSEETFGMVPKIISTCPE